MSDVGRRGPVDLRLVGLVPALRTHLVVIAGVASVTAMAVVVQAEALASGLVDLIAGRTASGSATLLTLLVTVAVVRGAATAVTEWSAARAMRSMRSEVRRRVLDHAVLDADRATGAIASREATIATTGVDQLEPYVRQFLPALLLAVTVPLVAGARILFADLLSAALIAVTVPLIPVFMVLIGRMTERRTARQWAVLQRLGAHFLDVLEGMPTLRLFGRAEAQRDSVHDVSEQYRATTLGALRVAFLSALALELIATLSVALIAVEIGLRLAGGSLDLRTALVVLLLTPECYLPLRRVGASFHAAQAGLDASDDLHELLDRPTLPIGDRAAPTTGTLQVRGAGLMRGGRSIVDDLDLDVAPGTVTAVSGPSGIGKSTLIEACRGRLAARSGAITVQAIDVRDLEPASWADQLTVIGQRLAPVAAQVSDDVRAGTDATGAAVIDALADVGLTDLAHRRCDELSGGQLRRVQVARALVAVRSGRARFVFADEPTAHLDAASADAVWAALGRLARDHGAAVLVATHDPRCRSVADRVVELSDSGTNAGLVASPVVSPVPAPGAGHDVDVSPPTPAVRAPDVTLTLAPPLRQGSDPRRHVAIAQRPPTTDAPTAADLRRALRRVLALARPVRRRFVGAAGLGTAAELCTIGLAGAAAWLIVRAAEQPDLAALSVAILGVRAFGTGKGVFRYAERLATHDTGLRSLSEIRAAVVARLAEIAPAGIPGWQRGDLVQRVVADVDRLLDLFVRALGPVVAVAVTAIGALAITVAIDATAGLVLFASLMVVGVMIPAVTMRGEGSIGPALTGARATLSSRVLTVTEGLDQLWANRMFDPARRDADVPGELIDELEQDRARLRMLTGGIVTAAPLLTATATLAVLSASSGSLSGPAIGVLVLWPLAILELVGTMNEASASVPSIAGSAHRVITLLDTPDPVAPPIDPQPVPSHPAVALDGVTARWPGSEVDALGPVSMHLAPGSFAEISGPSGSGKSTLAAVLVDFLATRSGDYRLDAVRVDDATGSDVRRRVTWIQQLPWIADSNVRENLRIADPSADDARLVAALEGVRLDRWLRNLPAGLDSRLGRGGAAMSGGEAQRLALARVLLSGHEVVVLDEPTANLDVDTATGVLTTVLEHCSERTTILLGHH